MKTSPLILPALFCALGLPPTLADAQSPATPPPAIATPTPSTPPKKQKKEKTAEKTKKTKKDEKSSSPLDPKNFLVKLILNADEDGDGTLSLQEFRQVPLLKELKQERIDSLFAEIDGDLNASLSTEEIGQGLGKITGLAKESRTPAKSKRDDNESEDGDALNRQARKLKELIQP